MAALELFSSNSILAEPLGIISTIVDISIGGGGWSRFRIICSTCSAEASVKPRIRPTTAICASPAGEISSILTWEGCTPSSVDKISAQVSLKPFKESAFFNSLY
eukprot:Lithocolla_globosa_v1_NODE_38_length_8412_cov_18.562642.p5 type:complete len:104 gc:universal NODE_38_length_8412_cov_18.562642:6485-6174(-)